MADPRDGWPEHVWDCRCGDQLRSSSPYASALPCGSQRPGPFLPDILHAMRDLLLELPTKADLQAFVEAFAAPGGGAMMEVGGRSLPDGDGLGPSPPRPSAPPALLVAPASSEPWRSDVLFCEPVASGAESPSQPHIPRGRRDAGLPAMLRADVLIITAAPLESITHHLVSCSPGFLTDGRDVSRLQPYIPDFTLLDTLPSFSSFTSGVAFWAQITCQSTLLKLKEAGAVYRWGCSPFSQPGLPRCELAPPVE